MFKNVTLPLKKMLLRLKAQARNQFDKNVTNEIYVGGIQNKASMAWKLKSILIRFKFQVIIEKSEMKQDEDDSCR